MRVVYYVAASIDGRIADANHGVGWLDAFDDVDLGFHDFFARVGAAVMGRKTFNFVHTYGSWPYGNVPGVILTHSPLPEFDAPIRTYDGDLEALISELKQQTDKDIWIVGGGDVAAQLLGMGLIDEMEVYTMPVVLGAGPGLLGVNPPEVQLQIAETMTYSNGVVKTVYQPTGYP